MSIEAPEAVQPPQPETIQAEYPWLLFRLMGKPYAINISTIISISTLPEVLRQVPNSAPYMRGIFYLRDRVVPLYDLRVLFAMPTVEQEYQEFTGMLEQRKQDHLYWAQVLEECIQKDEPFPLATDPHKCAFGQWFDRYEVQNQTIGHHMHKIEEPHRKLHEAALEVERCKQQHDQCQRPVCLKTILDQVKGQYVPVIVRLLDEAKEIFRDSFREMVVVMEEGGKLVGIVVDEVIAVEPIAERTDLPSGQGMASDAFTSGVAQGKAGENILLIDRQALFALA